MVRYPPLAQLLRAQGISVRHLLSLSAGLDDEAALFQANDGDNGTLLDRLASATILCEAGKLVSNERVGFITAGHIIEQLTGKSFLEAIGARVLGPLSTGLHIRDKEHIRNATAGVRPNGFDACGGDRLMMTSDGLLRLADCITGRTPSARAVLSPESRRELLQSQAFATGDSFIAGCGLGLNLYRNGLAGLSGAVGDDNSHLGFTTSGDAMLAFQATGFAADAFSLGGIFSDLLDLVAGAVPYCEDVAAPAAMHEPGRLVGTYRRSRSVISISERGRHLRLEGHFGLGSYLHGGGPERVETIEANLVPMLSGRYGLAALSSSSAGGHLKFSELALLGSEGGPEEFIVAGGVTFGRA